MTNHLPDGTGLPGGGNIPTRMRSGNHSKALVFYHYLYPDDVVSAVLFTGLCTGLAAKGWEVTGCSSNRAWHDDRRTYPKSTVWNGVRFRRMWRPPFRQASSLGRLGNAVWMTAVWSLLAFNPKLKPDVLVMGTDPVFSPFVSLTWHILRPRLRIAYWCFDLYPDAAIADGMLRENQAAVRFLKPLLRRVYRRFDLIVDIGICMRQRLTQYAACTQETIVPWALVERDAPAPTPLPERAALFGDVNLGLLYAGNFGRAHSWRGVFELAKELHPNSGQVVFAVRGNGVENLRKAAAEAQAPIRFADFTSAERLEARLSAADIHIVSLREEWTGTVVPSKFFGALAIGRPVLFVGSRDSAVARWIRQFGVGWVLDPQHVPEVAADLAAWARCPEAKARMFELCCSVYRQEFSRSKAIQQWDQLLRGLVSADCI